MLISKSLYKQSWKANFSRWLIVTLSSCFIVASVILIVGNLNLGEIKKSVDDLVDDAAKQREIQENAIEGYEDIYDVYEEVIDNYQGNLEILNKVLKGEADEADYIDFSEEFKDAVRQINKGKKQIADGKAELSDGQAQLNSAKAEYNSKKGEYEATLADLYDKQNQLNSGISNAQASKADLQNKLTQVNDGIVQLEEGLAQIDAYQEQLSQLQSQKQQLEQGIAEAQAGLSELEQKLSALEEQIARIDEQLTQADDEQAETLSAQKEVLLSAKAEIEGGIAQYEAGILEATQNLDLVNGGITQILAGLPDEETVSSYKQQLEALKENKGQLEAGIVQYTAGINEAQANLDKVNNGIAQINSGLSSAQSQIAEAESQLETGRKKMADAESVLRDSLKELEEETTKGIRDEILKTVYEEAAKENDINSAQRLRDNISAFLDDYDAGLIVKEADVSMYAKDYVANEVYIQALKDHSENDSRLAKEIAMDAIDQFNNKLALGTDRQEAVDDITESLLDKLPDGVHDALDDIREANMYALVIGNILFRIAGLLLPIIFVIMAGTNLLAGQVDSGSMAYILSTPIKRKKVGFTQMIYLVSSIVAMYLLISLTGVLCVNTIHNEMFTLNEEHIIKFSLGACCVILAMSGICFMSSGIFNREKDSLSVGGGVCMLFLVCSILGLFGEPIIPSVIRIDAMNYFNYMTIISFFKIVPILEGSTEYITGLCILLLIGLITYNIGIVAFDKKDLPL